MPLNVTYYLLALTITLAFFYRQRNTIYAAIIITTLCALHENLINLIGVAELSCLALLTSALYQIKVLNKTLRLVSFIGVAVILGGLALHWMPGFDNIVLLDHIRVSAASRRDYTMYFNVDKVLAALIIYSIGPLCSQQTIINMQALKQTVVISSLCIVTILAPVILSGYIHLDPKIPSILPIWSINNFLLVCFSEEVIFRGFLQGSLQDYFPKTLRNTYMAIVLSSLVSGAYHYRDGWVFIGFACLSGLFYGYTYFKTRRILCAMLVHFALNLTHLLVFTYPS